MTLFSARTLNIGVEVAWTFGVLWPDSQSGARSFRVQKKKVVGPCNYDWCINTLHIFPIWKCSLYFGIAWCPGTHRSQAQLNTWTIAHPIPPMPSLLWLKWRDECEWMFWYKFLCTTTQPMKWRGTPRNDDWRRSIVMGFKIFFSVTHVNPRILSSRVHCKGLHSKMCPKLEK